MRGVAIFSIGIVVVALLAGCSGPGESTPDFTAPRDEQPSAPYNEIGPGAPPEAGVNDTTTASPASR